MNDIGDVFDDASHGARGEMSPLCHDMDFSGSQPPASATHSEVLQSIVDGASPSVDGRIILTQRRGLCHFSPPAVNPNSVWSRYTQRGGAGQLGQTTGVHAGQHRTASQDSTGQHRMPQITRRTAQDSIGQHAGQHRTMYTDS